MTQAERATTRISAGLAGFLSSLSENENAATRALMLIGADQIGIDPTLVADDLRLTIGARLPLEVYDKLLAMLSRVRSSRAVNGTGVQSGTIPRPSSTGNATPAEVDEQLEQAVLLPAPDPFGSIGFDFDAAAQ